MTRQIIFLGGIFLPREMEEIKNNSRGVIQNAADALQKALLRGLSSRWAGRIKLVNIPFVGSFPRLYRRPSIPSCRDVLYENIEVLGVGFNNVRFIRTFTRFLAALRGLRQASGKDAATIIIYSAHLPFLAAGLLHARFARGAKICLVLPDLPEFMGEGGLTYRIAKKVESRLFYTLTKRVDYFVLLTRFMADRLGLAEGQYTVVEGVYDPEGVAGGDGSWSDEPGIVFLYTGTLAARYGILDLLEAFRSLERADARLWICGAGDARQTVESLSQADPRIRYFGQVSREEAVALQARAHVLVNPRRPEGEFTKFSFPSKTMEYLAAGRPVVMHRLPGMPDEYLPYLRLPPAPDAGGLAAALREVAALPEAELRSQGAAGRQFVLREKTPAMQCARIVELIGGAPSFIDKAGRESVGD